MKEIKLYGKRQGIVLVDDEDYDRLSIFRWYLGSGGYIGRSKTTVERRDITLKHIPKYIRLHREVLNFPDYQIDHKDRNRLNNQKDNLRESSQSQNVANTSKKSSLTSSKYKGVSWHKNEKMWYSSIKLNGKSKHLGRTSDEKEAAILYNEAATKYFGEFAVLNIIDNGKETRNK